MPAAKASPPQLPAKQLAILAVARFAEPLALTSVFPYMPEMIRGFGVEEDKVAKWAGLTSATFSIAQSVFAVPWGRASDRFGRKPVILLGLLITMVTFMFWGMATSLPMAITIRALQGSGNGNVGIIRTMVAEMVPERELQPRAFSIMPLVWSVGSVFGPAFGGFFANPATQYPALFGDSVYFKKYPFALPNIVACVVFFVSFTTGALFLKETLESKRHARDWGLVLGEKLTSPFKSPRRQRQRRRRLSFMDDEAAAPLLSHAHKQASQLPAAPAEPPKTSEIFTSQTSICLLTYTFLAMHSVAYDQVLPVFLNYPELEPGADVQLPFKFAGGFGLRSGRIGTIFTVYGIASGLIQFLVFPKLCSTFGVLNCFKGATLTFPVLYILTPYTALIRTPAWRYALFLAIMLAKGFAVIVGFPCMTILLTNSAASLRTLGTLNGVATTTSGVGRALGPALAGAAFSSGVARGYVIAAWWLLAAVALVGALPAWWIVESDGPSARRPAADAEHHDEDDEDEDEDDVDDGESAAPVDHTAIVAGDAADLFDVPEDVGLAEPADGSECDSLLGDLKAGRGPRGAPAARVRMRRMSAAGEDLEHDGGDASWRDKIGDR